MEVIKKTVKMAMTVSGITESEFAIVPDLNTFYNFKILLTSKNKDVGFFDNVKPYYEIQGIGIYEELNESD